MLHISYNDHASIGLNGEVQDGRRRFSKIATTSEGEEKFPSGLSWSRRC